jgi:hypothetical protein
LYPPRKGVFCDFSLNHSSSLKLYLSAWLEDTTQQFLYPEQYVLSVLFKTRELHTLPLFGSGVQTDSCTSSSLYPRFSFFTFIIQQYFVGPIPPICGSDQEISRWVLFPSSHWLLRKTSQLLAWLVNIFFGIEDCFGSDYFKSNRVLAWKGSYDLLLVPLTFPLMEA